MAEVLTISHDCFSLADVTQNITKLTVFSLSRLGLGLDSVYI